MVVVLVPEDGRHVKPLALLPVRLLEDKFNLKEGVGAAACVTVMVRSGAPSPLTIIVALLEDVVELGEAVTLKEPLPLPFAPEMFNQLAFVLADHPVFEVTLIVVGPPADGGRHDSGDKVRRFEPCCITLIVRVIPPPVTVIVPVRENTLGLGCAVILKEPLPLELVGDR